MTQTNFMIKNVKILYPNVFNYPEFQLKELEKNPKYKLKYTATLLLNKNDKNDVQQYQDLRKACNELCLTKNKMKITDSRIKYEYIAVRDGVPPVLNHKEEFLDNVDTANLAINSNKFDLTPYYIIKGVNWNKIPVVDGNKDTIYDEKEIYSGCWVNASISLAAYDINGYKGVRATILALQKIKDDEPLVIGQNNSDVISQFDVLENEKNIKENINDIPF